MPAASARSENAAPRAGRPNVNRSTNPSRYCRAMQSRGAANAIVARRSMLGGCSTPWLGAHSRARLPKRRPSATAGPGNPGEGAPARAASPTARRQRARRREGVGTCPWCRWLRAVRVADGLAKQAPFRRRVKLAVLRRRRPCGACLYPRTACQHAPDRSLFACLKAGSSGVPSRAVPSSLPGRLRQVAHGVGHRQRVRPAAGLVLAADPAVFHGLFRQITGQPRGDCIGRAHGVCGRIAPAWPVGLVAAVAPMPRRARTRARPERPRTLPRCIPTLNVRKYHFSSATGLARRGVRLYCGSVGPAYAAV